MTYAATRRSAAKTTIDDNRLPGLAGGTYVTRKLGIKNLRDVP